MRPLNLLLLCLGLSLSAVSRGQINVSLEFPNRTFLLYESVPLRLSIQNLSGEGIQLGGDAADARLRLVVRNLSNQIIARTDVPLFATPWLVPDGIRSSRTFDLTELFLIRSAESYRVEIALIAQEDTWPLPPVLFNVVTGTNHGTIRRRNVDRTFTLLSVNRNNRNDLMLRVSDFQDRRVIATYFLEHAMLFFPPEMRVDPRGSLHILFYKFADLMVYCRFQPDGTPIIREYLAPGNRRPTLVPHDEFGFWVPDGILLDQEEDSVPAPAGEVLDAPEPAAAEEAP